jgi:hypothetical protein
LNKNLLIRKGQTPYGFISGEVDKFYHFFILTYFYGLDAFLENLFEEGSSEPAREVTLSFRTLEFFTW